MFSSTIPTPHIGTLREAAKPGAFIFTALNPELMLVVGDLEAAGLAKPASVDGKPGIIATQAGKDEFARIDSIFYFYANPAGNPVYAEPELTPAPLFTIENLQFEPKADAEPVVLPIVIDIDKDTTIIAVPEGENGIEVARELPPVEPVAPEAAPAPVEAKEEPKATKKGKHDKAHPDAASETE